MRVTESMGPAWETMKRLLLRPFNLGTWFSLGLIFFLQSCIEGGGSGCNIPNPGGRGGGGSHGGSRGGSSSDDLAGLAHDLFRSHGPFPWSDVSLPETGVLIGIAVAAIAITIPMIILAYWLGTRGQMMAIRSVAEGRADVGVSWSETREPAGRLFRFHLVMLGIGTLVFLPILGGAVLVFLPVFRETSTIESAIPALGGISVLALLAVIPFALVGAMARNFVAPLMLKHGFGAREGWTHFWAVGKGHIGGICGFFVLRFFVAFGAAILGTLAAFVTCCIGFLPVVHQTLMAPYHVFERAWTLEVLAAMSPEFDLRTGGDEPPPGYPPRPPAGPAGGPGYNPYAAPNPYAPGGYGPGGYGGPPGGTGSPY